MKFVNREEELKTLNRWWAKKKAQLVILYGKRRAGKTELIKRFIKGKPSLYFLSDKVSDKENLKMLSRSAGGFFGDKYLESRGIDDWYAFFDYLRTKNKRMIVAIDEFPYLAEANDAISSVFQKGWDEYLKNTNIFLILSGSSIGMMERETLSYKAPLYGRRNGQILLQSLRFKDFRKFFPAKKFDDLIRIHTVTGGIPAYILQFAQKSSFENALRENIFNTHSYLYNEVEFILKEELREPRTYFSILKAIAFGKRKFGEIVNDTGLQKNIIMKYLHVLEDLHLIKKEVPVTEEAALKSKRGIYFINEQFFIFWFNYIFPFKSELELERIDSVFLELSKSFDLLVSMNYEKVSREILMDVSPKIFPFLRIGRWWDNSDEIDIVALNEKENSILFGEAKWSNKPIGINILKDLKRKSQEVIWGKENRREYYCLFSKSGYTPEMLKSARQEKVFLFHKDRLLDQ